MGETIDYLLEDDIETARFSPAERDADSPNLQVVAIAPLEGNRTSIVCEEIYYLLHPQFIHIILTEAETDMVIAALQENKRRWASGRVVK